MTYSDVAAQALREAARFYRMVGEQNPGVQDNLSQAAVTFETLADRLEDDPTGDVLPPPGDGR